MLLFLECLTLFKSASLKMRIASLFVSLDVFVVGLGFMLKASYF